MCVSVRLCAYVLVHVRCVALQCALVTMWVVRIHTDKTVVIKSPTASEFHSEKRSIKLPKACEDSSNSQSLDLRSTGSDAKHPGFINLRSALLPMFKFAHCGVYHCLERDTPDMCRQFQECIISNDGDVYCTCDE